MLKEIDHIALVVRDPARTATLFKDLFASTIITRKDSDGHDETYIQLGGTWFVLVKADVQRSRTGDHIAFSAFKVRTFGMRRKTEADGPRVLLCKIRHCTLLLRL